MIYVRHRSEPPPPYYWPEDLGRERAAVHLYLGEDGWGWREGCMVRERGKRRYFGRSARANNEYGALKGIKPIAWCPVNPQEWSELPVPMRDDLIWPDAYSQPGAISRDEAALRVARALRSAGLAVVWVGPPWKRTDLDRKDELVAIAWFGSLSEAERRLVIAQAEAPAPRWRDLSKQLGTSHEALRKRFKTAVDKLHQIANTA